MTGKPDTFSQLESRGTEPPEEFATQAAGQQRDDSQGGEMVPKSRLDEALRRVSKLESAQDAMVLAAMRGGQQQPQAQQPQPQSVDMSVLEGLEPEVVEGIKTLIQASNRQFAEEFHNTYGPILSAAARDHNIREVETTVDGYKENEALVREMYESLPPEQREEYDSRLGVENLTLRVMLDKERRARAEGGPIESSQAGMAAMTPASREGSGLGNGQRGGDIDPWSLTDEEFERFKRSQGVQ